MVPPDFKDLLNKKKCVHVGTSSSNPMFQLDLHEFPSTRYQGSKRKITPWLWESFRELDFSSALDIFGGTGSVSFLLKKMGKAVTYNDILQFNHKIGLAIIENDKVILDQNDIEQVQLSFPKVEHHFVRDTFSGVYFTDEENEWVDKIITNIKNLKFKPREMKYKQALLYYSLFQSCLIKRPFNLFHRRNLYLRFADVRRDFGNKTSWDKPFDEHFSGFCDEANNLVFKGQKSCRAIHYDALDIPNERYDLVYIDPPYLKKDSTNESSDYFKCYHFLEGLCSYNVWDNLIDYDTPNLRMKQTDTNKWINCNTNTAAFDSLFEKFSESIIVISYKKFGIPSIETLIRMLKRHGKTVRTHSRHYKYALNHQNGEAKLNREVILIAE